MNEERVFHEALARTSPDERAAYLDRACAGDPALRASIEALLRANVGATGFLDPPAPAPVAAGGPPDGQRPGTAIGPYKLLEQIGEGGFGVVHMAEQSQPVRRKVALKLLKPGMDSRQVVARFEAERQALAIMDHPNIAKVLDGGATPSGRPYFVMELVKGVPVTDFCDENHLTPRQRLELFVDVCGAVQHAHQKGIIHRDLKPSNILVSRYDTTPVVKVIDFGVAKAVGQELTDKTLFTGVAQMIGTPLYMSPEQAGMSDLDVDTRSDIYSLGVLLYELLTGTTPFARERFQRASYDEIRRIIREEEPARPSLRISTLGLAAETVSTNRRVEPKELRRLVRGELDWIVMKTLEKDRNRRYDTASALAADVRRYLADEPVQACPPSAGYRLGKFLRRNRGPALAGGVVALALFGGAIGVAYGSMESGKQRAVASLWAQAEVARGHAEAARDGELAARREAQDARDRLAAFEYGRTMQVAHQEWRENNVPAALALLDRTRADLRGWEWRFVHRLCHAETLTLVGHAGHVLSAAFSPDGTRVVTGSDDKTARVWDARTGALGATLAGHTAAVAAAAFSPDGRRVVTGSKDGTARVWDAATGAETLVLKGHGRPVVAASFGPDGARILTASADRTARVWHAATGELAFDVLGHPKDVTAAVFSRDGARILTGCVDGAVRVWDAKTGAAVVTLKSHGKLVWSVAFSPDGARIATAAWDRTARVWDATTGAEVLVLTGHTRAVKSVSFSPDGARLLTASDDRTARVWDATTGAEAVCLRGHVGYVQAAAFGPDGARLVTAGGDKTARIWDATAGVEALTVTGHTAAVWSAAFAPDGAWIATGCVDGTVRVWDARTGAFARALKGHAAAVCATAFSPDGARIATACVDGTAGVWDAKTGARTLTLTGHTHNVLSAAFSPDGARIVTASSDRTARVWDATTGAPVFALTGHAKGVYSAAFGPDGLRLATAHGDGTARVWDARTGAEVLTLAGHAGSVRSVSWSRDGSRIATGSDDGAARAWDVKTGTELLALTGHTGTVHAAAFSPDGARLVTGSFDGTARVWDAKTGAEVLTLKGHTGLVWSAAFSPDGARILTGGDSTARVWDATPSRNRPLELK